MSDVNRVAVLGVGTMGAGMAGNLLRAGLDVTVWNRTPGRTDDLARAGATVASTPAEAVAGADVALTMVFDEAAVAEVAAAMVDHLEDDAIWLQCATVGPAGVRRLAALRPERFVDAPVLGTRGPAEAGTLTVLASGERDDVARAAVVLDAIGSRTVVAGERIGDASALKLACNAWVATLTAGTAQSLEIARALGLAPELFLEAIAGTPTDSPYAHVKGGAMLAGMFEPQFAADGLLKDLRLAAGETSDTLAPGLLPALVDLYERTGAAGLGGADIAAVVKALRLDGPPGQAS